MTSKRVLAVAVLATSLMLPSSPRVWAGPIVDISNDPTYSWAWAEDLTLGFSFSVSDSLRFNALAVFDVRTATPGVNNHTNAPGLVENHRVAVWDAWGNMLASTTVLTTDPTVASANTYGVWVYRMLASPVTLTKGTYTIGAFYTGLTAGKGVGDPVMVQQLALTVPGVTYLAGKYLYSSTFAMPTGTFPDNEQQYFGPTMLSIPDAGATLGLLGAALMAVGVLRRRTS